MKNWITLDQNKFRSCNFTQKFLLNRATDLASKILEKLHIHGPKANIKHFFDSGSKIERPKAKIWTHNFIHNIFQSLVYFYEESKQSKFELI